MQRKELEKEVQRQREDVQRREVEARQRELEKESQRQKEETERKELETQRRELEKEGVKLIVMHNSGLKQLERYCNSEPITSEAPDSVLPGGVAKVTENKGKLHYEILLKEKPNSGHK